MNIYGIIGWKNAGKTSLMERLVAHLTARGLTVSTVKHVHHDVDLDQPGKDTFRHRSAGAFEVVLASAHRFAILHEHRGPEPDLTAILARMAPVDLVLVEGYKRDAHPKIEVFRNGEGRALIATTDPTVRAVATDTVVAVGVPVLDLNDTAAVADFILREVGLLPAPRPMPRPAPPTVRGGSDAAFDTVVIVDWSAKASPSPEKPSADAIWIGICRTGHQQSRYFRTRQDAEQGIGDLLDAERDAGRRVLAGFDFPFGYPAGFAAKLTGHAHARSVWAWLAAHVTDDGRNGTNRLAVGAQINALFAPARGPFWGRPAAQAIANLSFTKDVDYAAIGLSERRTIEQRLHGAKSTFQLMGAGSVGSQALTGLPMIHRLQQRKDSAVWPFDDIANAQLVLAEVYPSLLNAAVARDTAAIKDEAQVRLLAKSLWALAKQGQLAPLFEVPDVALEEGWILGAGAAPLLEQALTWT